MKKLNPSLKENKRYLLVKGVDLKKNIEKAILDFVGVLGLSKINLQFIENKKNEAIISINRDSINSVRASIVVYPKKMEVTKVSGTLKGLRG